MNAPKLLSKPQIIETPTTAAVGNTRGKIKEPEKIMETLPRLASLPPEPSSVKGGWNRGSKPGEAEGSTAGAGNLFNKGDVGVVGGSSLEGGGGGQGSSGLGRGAKGEGSGGGGVGSGEAVSGLARPLGGYQVKPLYPESARKAGAQGITLLKLRVLENGKVGEVQIEQSAGHPDLDMAAADAVRQWLFEPARMGKQPIAVWVLTTGEIRTPLKSISMARPAQPHFRNIASSLSGGWSRACDFVYGHLGVHSVQQAAQNGFP